MMNTKASRNKLILKLARKNSTIISPSCSTHQRQSTWELVNAENELSYYSETQYIDQTSKEKVLNWLENKEPTFVNNIVDSSQCALKSAEYDYEQGKGPTLVNNIVKIAENELSYYSETKYIDQTSKEKVLNWLENKESTFVNNIVDSSQCALKSAEYDYKQDKDPTLVNNIVDSSQCAPDYIDDSEHSK